MHQGIANASLLNTYNEERLPVIAQMLNKTTELLEYNFGSCPKPTEAEIRKDMNQLGVNYRGSSLVYYEPLEGDAAFVKGIGYNQTSETDALPGDRAPDAPGLIRLGENNVITSLFDVFSPARHTLLVFADDNTAITTLAAIGEAVQSQPANTVRGVLLIGQHVHGNVSSSSSGFDLAFVDGEGHTFRGYRVQGKSGVPLVVIVRPDGVIGARFRGPEGIARYFHGVFNGRLTNN